jgi:hypothetical protein
MDELRRVRVRGVGGATAEARVVDERDGTVYVISEREYQQALHDGVEIEARLGYPQADVTSV